MKLNLKGCYYQLFRHNQLFHPTPSKTGKPVRAGRTAKTMRLFRQKEGGQVTKQLLLNVGCPLWADQRSSYRRLAILHSLLTCSTKYTYFKTPNILVQVIKFIIDNY